MRNGWVKTAKNAQMLKNISRALNYSLGKIKKQIQKLYLPHLHIWTDWPDQTG